MSLHGITQCIMLCNGPSVTHGTGFDLSQMPLQGAQAGS